MFKYMAYLNTRQKFQQQNTVLNSLDCCIWPVVLNLSWFVAAFHWRITIGFCNITAELFSKGICSWPPESICSWPPESICSWPPESICSWPPESRPAIPTVEKPCIWPFRFSPCGVFYVILTLEHQPCGKGNVARYSLQVKCRRLWALCSRN